MTDTGSAISDNARSIISEATQVDGTPPVSDQALLGAAQGKRELIDFGEAVGILGEGELDLVVRPSSRGKGIGKRSLEVLLGSEGRGSSLDLLAWAHGENPAAHNLLRGAGFSPVRILLRMTLDPERLQRALADVRELPAGYELTKFNPDDGAQADDWVRVNAAAFASHPEQGKMTRDDFDALTREPWFDAADLLLAYPNGGAAPGTLAGFAWVKTTRETVAETELYALGVHPEQAGTGLGAALLGAALQRMQSHQPQRVTLYVDGDNDGALSLYRRAGFEIEQRSTQYRLNNR